MVDFLILLEACRYMTEQSLNRGDGLTHVSLQVITSCGHLGQ